MANQSLKPEVKRRLYKLGYYVMGVPPVQTGNWHLDDWVRFIDATGHWITGTAKKIIDGNPSDKPMIDCDYYHWLEDNYSGHKIRDLKAYLFERGFVRGRDILTEETLRNLGYIHSQYWAVNVKPKLEARA